MKFLGTILFLFTLISSSFAQQMSVYFAEGNDQISDSAQLEVIDYYSKFLSVYNPPIVLRGFSD